MCEFKGVMTQKKKKNSSLTHILAGLLNVFKWIRWKHGRDPTLLSAPVSGQKKKKKSSSSLDGFSSPPMTDYSLGV